QRYDKLQSFGDIASLFGESIRARPLGVVELIGIKAIRSWYATDSHRHEGPILLIQVAYLVVLSYVAARAWKHGGLARDLAVVVLLIVAYFWGMTVLTL